MSKVIGIDISKKTFDIAFLNTKKQWEHNVYDNTSKGIKKFIKVVDLADHCVMEASGPYYMQLAFSLSENEKKVSVVNPLVIRRYGQMKLVRAKTDKKDAKIIAEYGKQEKPKQWPVQHIQIIKMRQMVTALQGISKQIRIVDNQMQAFEATGVPDKATMSSLTLILKGLLKQKKELNKILEQTALADYKETVERIKTIPGMGIKAAVMLVLITDNFTKFENYKQLIAYVGFSPRIYQSGSSVRGKGHICKMGNSQIRKILYMCSWSAKKCNNGCISMYNRLKEKGKPERVIKIALANKLLKQAFAIVTKKINYAENYMPKPCF